VNEQQKQRAIAALTKWWAADSNKAVLSTGYEMAGVLQELIEQPTSVPVLTVECEPDYWSGGHYHEGTLPHIDPTAVWKLPIGTKLYTAPAAPEPEPFVWWSDADDVVFQSLHNGKHLPFDQRDDLRGALEQLLETMELPPDRNCSCHISLPCNDCVEYSGIREAIEHAETVLAKVKGGDQ